MPKFGGLSPFPLRFGGGRPRVQTILESLNADRGTAFDIGNRETTAYVIDMANARALSAAWGTNARLGNIWVPASMPLEVLGRWEKILALAPASGDTETTRRGRVQAVFARLGQATISGYLHTVLEGALGDAFVGVEYIDYADAAITVPDGTYPWGTASTDAPWSSSVAHILVRMQKPTGWTEIDFYNAAGLVPALLDPVLPAWATVDWYRAGPISAAVGTITAAGFFLDDAQNLDNEVFGS